MVYLRLSLCAVAVVPVSIVVTLGRGGMDVRPNRLFSSPSFAAAALSERDRVELEANASEETPLTPVSDSRVVPSGVGVPTAAFIPSGTRLSKRCSIPLADTGSSRFSMVAGYRKSIATSDGDGRGCGACGNGSLAPPTDRFGDATLPCSAVLHVRDGRIPGPRLPPTLG